MMTRRTIEFDDDEYEDLENTVASLEERVEELEEELTNITSELEDYVEMFNDPSILLKRIGEL